MTVHGHALFPQLVVVEDACWTALIIDQNDLAEKPCTLAFSLFEFGYNGIQDLTDGIVVRKDDRVLRHDLFGPNVEGVFSKYRAPYISIRYRADNAALAIDDKNDSTGDIMTRRIIKLPKEVLQRLILSRNDFIDILHLLLLFIIYSASRAAPPVSSFSNDAWYPTLSPFFMAFRL